jgi:hypothetical protein
MAEHRDIIIGRYKSGNVPTAHQPDFAARRKKALAFLRDL